MTDYKIENTIVFQANAFRLLHNKKEIKLNQKENEVLQLLCMHSQHAVERATFLQEIWGDREGADINLNKTILTLRRKFDSLGYLDAINTIPRVGYILRLHAFANDMTETEQEMADEQLHIPSSPVKKGARKWRLRPLKPYQFLIAGGLLAVPSYLLHNLYMKNEVIPLSYEVTYKSPSLTIIKLADVTQSVNYPEFSAHLPIDKAFKVSISNTAISLLQTDNGKKKWIKVFIKEPGESINDQLTCIANHIRKNRPVDIYDASMTAPPPVDEHDDSYQVKSFYTPCLAGTTTYLGDLSTTLIDFSGNIPKGDQPSSWLQNVSFRDSNGELIFDFKGIYRAIYWHEKGDKNSNNFALTLSQRAIQIHEFKQHLIKNNKYLKIIFNEYESDELFVRSLSTADEKNITLLSSVFDGTLSLGFKRAQ